MPLEIGYKPMGSDKEIDHVLVDRNEGILLKDFSSGERQVLAIDCSKDGTEGRVQILGGDELCVDDCTGYVEPEELPNAIETVHIDKYRSHEQPYENEDGTNKGFIVTRYISDRTVSSTGVIPRNLLHPN